MRLLLDTHVFLGYMTADPNLSVTVRDVIRDSLNEVYLSVASVWEAVIKHALGKLPLPAEQTRSPDRPASRPRPREESPWLPGSG